MLVSRLSKQLLVYVASYSLIFSPFMAFSSGVTPSGGSNTQIDITANGTLQVNIAGPSASGISHNKYTDYNVGKGGVVLNNSTTKGVSQIGGIVMGNPNLKGSSAKIILNEVVSSNSSQLKGYTEVFGSSAAVVVANPGGITCDGCGFINSPDVTLTTGRPQMSDGALLGYDVTQGKIKIGRGGADLSGVDNFHLFSRQLEIDGNINGKNIDIAVGNNTINFIDYKTGEMIYGVDYQGVDGNEPLYAISSTSFGGMYGDRILMVATDRGVGVNMQGDLASHSGNLNITADGKISLKKVSSSNDLTIRSVRGGVNLGDETQSIGDAAVTAAGQIDINALFKAKGSIEVQSEQEGVSLNAAAYSGEDFIITSKKLTSVKEDKSLLSSGHVTITSLGFDLGSGSNALSGVLIDDNDNISIGSGYDFTLDAGAGNINLGSGSQLVSSKDLEVNGGNLKANGLINASKGKASFVLSKGFDNHGQFSSRDIDVQAEGTINNFGEFLARNNLSLAGSSFDNRGTLGGGDVLINAKGDIVNADILSSGSDLSVTAGGSFSNVGEVQAALNLGISSSKGLSNAGNIQSGGNLDLTASTQDLINAGSIKSSKILTLKADKGSISNALGGVFYGDRGLDLLSGVGFANGGDIQSDGALLATGSGSFVNEGHILSEGLLSIKDFNGLINEGKIYSNGSGFFDLRGDLINGDEGEVSAGGYFHIGVLGSIYNEGFFGSKGYFSLVSSDFINNSVLQSEGSLELDLQGDFVNEGGIVYGSSADIVAKSLDNIGLISSISDGNGFGDLSISLAEDLSNSGRIVHQRGSADINVGGDIQNLGANSLIYGENGLKLRSGFDISNVGTMSTDGGFDLFARDLSNQGDMRAETDMGFTLSGNFTNQGVIDYVKRNIISANQFNNSGDIRTIGGSIGNSALKITARSNFINSGSFLTSGDLNVTAKGYVDNRATGSIQASNIRLQSDQNITNANLIKSDGKTVLTAGGSITNTGSIEGVSETSLESRGSLSNEGKIYGSGLVKIDASSVVNDGTIEASYTANRLASNVIINSRGQVKNTGVINSTGKLSLETDGALILDNEESYIIGDGELRITAKSLTLPAGKIDPNPDPNAPKKKSLISSKGDASITLREGFTLNRNLTFGRSLTFTLPSLTNEAEVFADNLLIRASGDVHNFGTLAGNNYLNISAENIYNGRAYKAAVYAEDGVTVLEPEITGKKGLLYAGVVDNDPKNIAMALHAVSRLENLNGSEILSFGSMLLNGDLTDIDGKGKYLFNHGSLIESYQGDMYIRFDTVENRTDVETYWDDEIHKEVRYSDEYKNYLKVNYGIEDPEARMSFLSEKPSWYSSGSDYFPYHRFWGASASRVDTLVETYGLDRNSPSFYDAVVAANELDRSLTIAYNEENGLTLEDAGYKPIPNEMKVFNPTYGQHYINFATGHPWWNTEYWHVVKIDGKNEQVRSAIPIVYSDDVRYQKMNYLTEKSTIRSSGTIDIQAQEMINKDSLVIGGDNIQIQGNLTNNSTQLLKDVDRTLYYNYLEDTKDETPRERYTYYYVNNNQVTIEGWGHRYHEFINPFKVEYSNVLSLVEANSSVILNGTLQNGQISGVSGDASYKFIQGVEHGSDLEIGQSQVSSIGDINLDNISHWVAPEGGAVVAIDNDMVNIDSWLEATDLPEINIKDVPYVDSRIYAVNSNPDSKYLIETRPEFTSWEYFYGSDYFFERLGFDDAFSQRWRLLGDQWWQNRYIQDQIFNQTGRSFLDYDISGEVGQVQYLIDNSVEESERLGLRPGIPLTASQIASLDKDMVWYVFVEVQGHQVLTPVVYLTGETKDNKAQGATISAGNMVQITNGSIHNMGTIEGNKGVVFENVGNVYNQHGSVLSGGGIVINASGDVRNVSGKISGADVQIVAAGDIINKTSTYKLQTSTGYLTGIGEMGQIEATGGNVVLDAANITVEGASIGVFKSTEPILDVDGKELLTGNVILDADNINLETIRLMKESSYHTASSSSKYNDLVNLGSVVAAEGVIDANAKNNINITASTVAGSDGVNLTAGNNVNIGEAENKSHSSFSAQHKSFLSSSKQNSRSNETVSLGSQILSNGDINITADNDLNIQGSIIDATQSDLVVVEDAGGNSYLAQTLGEGGSVTLKAGNDVAIESAANSYDSYYHTESKGFSISGGLSGGGFGISIGYGKSESTDTADGTTHTGSSITAGKDLTITAGKDVNIKNAQLASGIGSEGGIYDEELKRSIGTTQITAGRDVNMETSEETHSTSHHDKSSFIGISAGIYQNVTAVGKTVENAVSAFEGGENNIDDIINASSGVSAVAGDAKTAITDTAGAYIGVGFMKQENNSSSFSLIHNSSMVNATHDFTVQAGRDITMVGVQAEVGNDLTLDADRHINLLAAQNENTASASGDSSGGFLGIAASVGINGMGFKPAYGYEQAEYAMDNQGTWHSTNNFAVGGNVNIQAGNVDKGIIGDITSEGTKIVNPNAFNTSDVTLSATGDVTLTGVVNDISSSSSGSSFGISNGMYDNIFHGGEGSYVASAQGSDMTDLALHGVSQGLSFLGGTEGIVQGVMSGGNVSGGLFDGLGGLEGAIGGLGKGVDNLGGVNLNYSDYSSNSQSQSVDKGAIIVGGNVSIESGRGGLSDGDINIISTDINAGGDFTFNAADGKGDMNVGALQTDNFANSDSNDFSFSFNPDAMMGGNIGDVSIGGGQSEYSGSGNNYTGSTITAGGEFSGVANDMSVIDSQIHANSGDLDIKGDLDIITTPDIWEGSGDSWNANVGTNGFGGGVGEITEDMNWSDTASGMWFTEGADIDVDGTTYLEGGAIVSETDGGLSLSTGELEVADLAINDYADDSYVGGQVNVNLGNVVTGEGEVFTENKYGTVEYESVGHDKQGSVNSTLSGLGELTIGGEQQDLAKLDDLGINTNADNIVTITKDESWEESFKVDLINVGVVAEQVDNLVNVVESFTAKVPDHVKAQGPHAEDLWRKSIANGKTQAEATDYISSSAAQELIGWRTELSGKIDTLGGLDDMTKEEVQVLLDLEVKSFADHIIQTNCASAGLTSEVCRDFMSKYNDIMNSNVDLTDLDQLTGLISTLKGAFDEGSVSQGQMDTLVGLAIVCADKEGGSVAVNDLLQKEGDLQTKEVWIQDASTGQYTESVNLEYYTFGENEYPKFVIDTNLELNNIMDDMKSELDALDKNSSTYEEDYKRISQKYSNQYGDVYKQAEDMMQNHLRYVDPETGLGSGLDSNAQLSSWFENIQASYGKVQDVVNGAETSAITGTNTYLDAALDATVGQSTNMSYNLTFDSASPADQLSLAYFTGSTALPFSGNVGKVIAGAIGVGDTASTCANNPSSIECIGSMASITGGIGKPSFISSSKITNSQRDDILTNNDDIIYINSDGIGYTKVVPEGSPLTVQQSLDILDTPKGSRPNPSTYMTQQQIDDHLSLFDDGAVKITKQSTIDNYGTIGPNDTFVLPRNKFNEIMEETGGDLRKVEEKLGLEQGYLANDAVVVDLKDVTSKDVNMPTGNERGVWIPDWRPGGYTSGGIPEATFNDVNASGKTIISFDQIVKNGGLK